MIFFERMQVWQAKALIIKTFELEDFIDSIKWNADNSKHYQYAVDGMASKAWLDEADEWFKK